MATIDLSATELAIVLQILRRHIAEPQVLVFGSRATHKAKRFSDLDLAVLGDEPLSSGILGALHDDFDESALPFKVDIVDWATTSPSFRNIIQRDGVVLTDASR